MAVTKKKFFSPIFSLPPLQRKMLMAVFYEDERKTSAPHITRRSFDDVGSPPFNSNKIFEICEKYSPARPRVSCDEATNALTDTIKEQDRKTVTL